MAPNVRLPVGVVASHKKGERTIDINADFSLPVLLHSHDLAWQDSPLPGVQRRMLDRLGDEVARATSIVRYAPNSEFSPHVHTGGEEFLVLEGVFQDEHGDYPAGSYVRNPPQSRHTPRSQPGCVIFVKLWQFDLADRTHVRMDIEKVGQVKDSANPGVAITPLFKDTRETVRIEHWSAGARVSIDACQGAELFLLSGGADHAGTALREGSWLRLPVRPSIEGAGDGRVSANTELIAGPEGAKVWIKTGHLRYVERPQD